ncbi:RNA polymerase sigma factor FliA [Rheinheimera baltica]|uniref:RNA polymerase sigma factor FliA n=1 Tax=Rheinheimera baltica TaxID=67576 RepID=A0ABT9HUT5_9GAMM|nr:RNA polymerase sigma factor FliA [Rheinheimera baltica]MDP5134885.1 RNA polymerase sigma factor FliA [Rheinheimera baltica]MDP5143153.1 RNA polymerase sigma factor FliA [Rheinheimera baltica]MDP5149863.1 RNA polymerase sigma factor FliA [Rheinheimera baltica]MDP5188744.1 RNA polymerase sigma factor FliA [Rheinheimera baltica]
MQQMVERHAPLVKRIAYHLMARLPASVLVDDLIQSGMIGLIEAAKNFDGSKGASFETFAGIRIRGAMLDEMRRGDWTPRSVHRNARLIAETIAQLESIHGRDIKDSEVAEKLDISLDEYHHMLSDISSGRIIGIEDLGVSEDVLVTSGDTDSDNLYESQASEAFHQDLAKTISSLPEREALVLSLYYNDELNLKEIGAVLNVSESRISQIHSQALVRLKARMQDWL